MPAELIGQQDIGRHADPGREVESVSGDYDHVTDGGATANDAQEANSSAVEVAVPHNTGMSRRGFLALVGAGIFGAALTGRESVEVGRILYNKHHVVPNRVTTLLPTTGSDTSSSEAGEPMPSPSVSVQNTQPEKAKAIELDPKMPKFFSFPALGLKDIACVPLGSEKTNKKNPWNGYEYEPLEFPVESGGQQAQKLRIWDRQGLPNSVTDSNRLGDPKVVYRIIGMGHTSDIPGVNLLLQDLGKAKVGDSWSMICEYADGDYEFTYTIYRTEQPAANGLVNDPTVYKQPTTGYKEMALISCRKDTASRNVVIAYLSGLRKLSARVK